jgi:hypothetical protein
MKSLINNIGLATRMAALSFYSSVTAPAIEKKKLVNLLFTIIN